MFLMVRLNSLFVILDSFIVIIAHFIAMLYSTKTIYFQKFLPQDLDFFNFRNN